MATPAVLLDIDGTLVDSNYLHVEAWSHAFHDLGLPVDAWRIHRAIGADADELLAQVAGGADDAARERAKELHSRHYSSLSPRLRVLPGARELVAELAERGFAVVLATSAPAEELEALRKVLDIDDHVHAVTSGEDVDTAKPEPQIVSIALERAGAQPSSALMIGDSVWDVKAAARAGVATIALLSGGTGRDDLVRAGARAVFEDADALRAAQYDGDAGALFSAILGHR